MYIQGNEAAIKRVSDKVTESCVLTKKDLFARFSFLVVCVRICIAHPTWIPHIADILECGPVCDTLLPLSGLSLVIIVQKTWNTSFIFSHGRGNPPILGCQQPGQGFKLAPIPRLPGADL